MNLFCSPQKIDMGNAQEKGGETPKLDWKTDYFHEMSINLASKSCRSLATACDVPTSEVLAQWPTEHVQTIEYTSRRTPTFSV